METNTFIFLFSVVIFLVGFVTFHLTSKDFNKIENGKFVNEPESGPRAQLFDLLFEAFSEKSESEKGEKENKPIDVNEAEVRELVRKMKEAQKKE